MQSAINVLSQEAYEEEIIKLPSDNFVFKTKPKDYQVDFFNFAEENPMCLNGDDQGLGKTKQAIDVAVYRKQNHGLKYCLIICGVNDLKYNWEEEIALHSNEQCRMLGKRIGGWGRVYPGSTNDKLEDLEKVIEGEIEEFFLIINIESLRRKEIQEKLFELTNTGDIEMVVIDEIHKASNAECSQGVGIQSLQSKYRLALTGTPLMNRPMDLYNVLKWLGIEKNTFYYFKNRYAKMGGKGGYAIIEYQNLGELQMKLDQVMVRRLKEEVLDLPEKVRTVIEVEMTPDQKKIYDSVKRMILADIQRIKLSPNPLAQLIRLRQATGWTGILSNTISESAKMNKLIEMVDEVVAKGHKVIIFSNWVAMTNVILAYMKHKKYNPAVITGEVKDKRAERLRFQEDDDCKVIIGSYKAMGTGYNLFKAAVVFQIDEPWNESNKDQAEDRMQRLGVVGTHDVFSFVDQEAVELTYEGIPPEERKPMVHSVTLLCSNTIDVRIHEIVEEKALLMKAIVEGDQETLANISIDTEDLVERLLS